MGEGRSSGRWTRGVVGEGISLAFVLFGVEVLCMHPGPCPPRHMFECGVPL